MEYNNKQKSEIQQTNIKTKINRELETIISPEILKYLLTFSTISSQYGQKRYKNFLNTYIKLKFQELNLNIFNFKFDNTYNNAIFYNDEISFVLNSSLFEKPKSLNELIIILFKLEKIIYKLKQIETIGLYEKLTNPNGYFIEKDYSNYDFLLFDYSFQEFHKDISKFFEYKKNYNNSEIEEIHYAKNQLKLLYQYLTTHHHLLKNEKGIIDLQNEKNYDNLIKILELQQKNCNEYFFDFNKKEFDEACYTTKCMFENILSVVFNDGFCLNSLIPSAPTEETMFVLAELLNIKELYNEKYANFILHEANKIGSYRIAINILNNKNYNTQPHQLQEVIEYYIDSHTEGDLFELCKYAPNIDQKYLKKLITDEYNMITKMINIFDVNNNSAITKKYKKKKKINKKSFNNELNLEI